MLTRYTLEQEYDLVEMVADDQGEWVKYEDVAPLLQSVRTTINGVPTHIKQQQEDAMNTWQEVKRFAANEAAKHQGLKPAQNPVY